MVPLEDRQNTHQLSFWGACRLWVRILMAPSWVSLEKHFPTQISPHLDRELIPLAPSAQGFWGVSGSEAREPGPGIGVRSPGV